MKTRHAFEAVDGGGLKSRAGQSGVTLIEILVSILVLSFGVLGVAALHTISLQGAQSAYERTQAVKVAYETLDFIRSYRGNIVAPSGNINQGRLNDVVQEAENALVSANFIPCLTITAEPNAQGHINVTVQWLENRNLAVDEDCPEDGLGRYVAGSRI